MSELLSAYQMEFNEAFESIDLGSLERVCSRLFSAYVRGETVHLAGNGGSASLAEHFACDLEKSTLGTKPMACVRRLRTHALSANGARLSAWANDEGYAHVFSQALCAHARSGDVLIAISASGNSSNIVECLEQAKTMGVTTIGVLGFSGGQALGLCDTALHVNSHDYGIVEGVHGVLSHLITRTLMQRMSVFRVSKSEATLSKQERLIG